MQALSMNDPVLIAMLVVIAVIGFFGFRYHVGFGQQVRKNRQAGVYDDPEFKRRIRALNTQRWTSAVAMILVGTVIIWASAMGVALVIWVAAAVVLLLPVTIWSGVAELRWRRLMTKGIEQATRLKADS